MLASVRYACQQTIDSQYIILEMIVDDLILQAFVALSIMLQAESYYLQALDILWICYEDGI